LNVGWRAAGLIIIILDISTFSIHAHANARLKISKWQQQHTTHKIFERKEVSI
jgi:hypothetical protein